MSRTVHVSAHQIVWPQACASCCGPANTTRYAKAERVTGVKVIRTQLKSWGYPFCTRCDEWLDMDEELEDLEDEEHDLTEKIKLGRRYEKDGIPNLPGDQLAVVILLSIFTLGVGLVSLPVFLHQHRRKCQALIDNLDQNTDDRENCRKEVERLRRRMKRLFPSGAEPARRPVEYLEWYGTIHTFRFANDEYARNFVSHNRRKIVSR